MQFTWISKFSTRNICFFINIKSFLKKRLVVIILNDLASPNMIIKMYFSFIRYILKILELFECRWGDPYMTANWNFVASLTRNYYGNQHKIPHHLCGQLVHQKLDETRKIKRNMRRKAYCSKIGLIVFSKKSTERSVAIVYPSRQFIF